MKIYVFLAFVITAILLVALLHSRYVMFTSDCVTEFTVHGHPVLVCTDGDAQ